MIDLPQATLAADQIAEHAEFFSYGTNDLTQTTCGIMTVGRDHPLGHHAAGDLGEKFIPPPKQRFYGHGLAIEPALPGGPFRIMATPLASTPAGGAGQDGRGQKNPQIKRQSREALP